MKNNVAWNPRSTGSGVFGIACEEKGIQAYTGKLVSLTVTVQLQTIQIVLVMVAAIVSSLLKLGHCK